MFIFLVLWAGIAWSGIGIDRERSGWLSPGTPILVQQVLLAWIIGLAFITFTGKFSRYHKLDFVVGILLWAVTGLVWAMEPMLRNSYFIAEPTPPNYEYYPYSDAALYDQFSQNVLIGTSREAGLTNRPLYSLLLALFHMFGGQKYQTVVLIQVLVLAFIPPVTYLLGSKLGGRPAGLVAAVLLMLRERNSITLTNIIEVSHVKLLMSDVPTMLMMLLFVYFFVKWLLDRENRYILGALAGACFGFAVLIRSQVLVLIPITLLGIVLADKSGARAFFQRAGIFLLGILVVVAPWVYRNYQISGRMVVEYQGFNTRFIASSYSSTPDDYARRPLETDQEYDARMRQQISSYILNNPVETARFYTSYFLHNEIASVAYLPVIPQFHSLYDYVKILGFWNAPYLGGLPLKTWPALFIVLCILAVGIGTSIHRHKWVGVLPILFHLGYSFSVAPVKQSGWRFILPVDWISVLYFSIGLIQLSFMAGSLVSAGEAAGLPSSREEKAKPANWKGIILVTMALAFTGMSIPLIEWSIPERYPDLNHAEMLRFYAEDGLLLQDGERISIAALENFLEADSAAVVLHGRALYPQYYRRGKFWGDDDSYPLAVRNIDRLQFTLIGPRGGLIFLPLTGAPAYFPNASDVFVVGCHTQDGVRALAIKVNTWPYLVATNPWPGWNCPSLK